MLSDYKTLSKGYIDNTNTYEGYASNNKKELEDVVLNINTWRNSKVEKSVGSTMNRKVCKTFTTNPTAKGSCETGIDKQYFVDNKVPYDVFVDTDQDGQTIAKYRRKTQAMTISDCFDKMKNHPDSKGIVYYSKDIGKEVTGTCFVIKNRFQEGHSEGSYKREGSILVSKAKTQFY